MDLEIQKPYKYNREFGYIGLSTPIDFSFLPETVQVEEKTLTKKKEFHVSLLYTKHVFSQLASKRPVDDVTLEKEIIYFFNEYVKATPIEFKELKNEFRLASYGENKSIVILCEVTNLKEFFRECEKKFDISLSDQPTHITLYITSRGLGINSEKAMAQCPKIVNEELSGMFNKFIILK